MPQTAAELLDYYRNALSPIATHAALQSQLAERDAAIRQQQAQRAQALQDQLTYAAQIDQYQRQAAAKHAIDTRNLELMRTGLQTQGEIARTVIENKARSESARALAGIAQEAGISAEGRKDVRLGGEAKNLMTQRDAARDRLGEIRKALSDALTPSNADASKAAVEAARNAGVKDKAMLASIAANPRELDSIKDEGTRVAAQTAYTAWAKDFQEKARNSNLGLALDQQFHDESVNYQTLANQFAQVAGFLPPQPAAPVAAPTAQSGAQQPDFNAVLAAAREAAAAQQKQQPPADTGPSLWQRMTTTPFLAPTNQPTPFDVPIVGGVENAIGQGLAGFASDTAGGTRRPLITADVNPELLGQAGSRLAGAGLTIAGLPSFAGLQSMHDARGTLAGMLPSWLSGPPQQQPPPLILPSQVPASAIQAQVLANAARVRDANAAAAALRGVVPLPQADQSL